MARLREFKIIESFEELNSLKSTINKYKTAKRLDAIILLKDEPTMSLSSISKILKISARTLSEWIKIYKENGLEALLAKETRNRQSKILTPEIHKKLEEKLNDELNPFSSYVEVQEWLKEEFEVHIEYQWLWKYLREKFNTRLKVPRKVNIKRNEEAGSAFLKTT